MKYHLANSIHVTPRNSSFWNCAIRCKRFNCAIIALLVKSYSAFEIMVSLFVVVPEAVFCFWFTTAVVFDGTANTSAETQGIKTSWGLIEWRGEWGWLLVGLLVVSLTVFSDLKFDETPLNKDKISDKIVKINVTSKYFL